MIQTKVFSPHIPLLYPNALIMAAPEIIFYTAKVRTTCVVLSIH